MAYDPNLPANHAPIVSQELRDQFNGLKALIDAQQAQITVLQQQVAALGQAPVEVAAGRAMGAGGGHGRPYLDCKPGCT